MLYFAYGPNMLRNRLEERIGSVDDIGSATLSNFSIIFNKKGADGTGETNIVKSDTNTVIGVVFNLTKPQFERLDRGKRGYNRDKVSVLLNDIEIDVQIYTADNDRVNNSLKPTSSYVQYLIDGAKEHKFPIEYIEKLLSYIILP